MPSGNPRPHSHNTELGLSTCQRDRAQLIKWYLWSATIFYEVEKLLCSLDQPMWIGFWNMSHWMRKPILGKGYVSIRGYVWVVYSFCLFCCLFIIVTWWYVWCIEWASGNQEEVQACLVTLWLFIISYYSLYKTTLGFTVMLMFWK